MVFFTFFTKYTRNLEFNFLTYPYILFPSPSQKPYNETKYLTKHERVTLKPNMFKAFVPNKHSSKIHLKPLFQARLSWLQHVKTFVSQENRRNYLYIYFCYHKKYMHI